MAKFDVHPLRSRGGYVVDCQADLLSGIATRFVVPLLPIVEAPDTMARLNPVFEIQGEKYVLFPQLAGSIPRSGLAEAVTSLEQHDLTIGNALDMLISGY